jgi:hypothetical protein
LIFFFFWFFSINEKKMNPLFVFYLTLAIIAISAIASTFPSEANVVAGKITESENSVTFDGRSFFINNERILFIAGSVHYPRLSQFEWSKVFALLKSQGINLIQTYVFWDIHEPSQGNYFFPNDESSSNLVKFIQVAQENGLYVNLRIGPYVCAEWNYGGLPVWLKKVYEPNTSNTIVYRTDNEQWMEVMLSFTDQVINLMNENHLFFGGSDNGPIVMLQLENEYGNIQSAYGPLGVSYIEKLSTYISQKKAEVKNLPWIMCQQGEGVGTAPPAEIINTCNGYYCDNWIEQHAKDFPNQPHMFTENWPGWFQNWGDPVPHRPAVDVAFSVARWFAKGGAYLNYYMAFGGTTYGRHVGGPNIITSYDYDVAVNEYLFPAEPKYSLLQRLHGVLTTYQGLLLAQLPPATVTPINGQNYCEQHVYEKDNHCLMFLSNWDTTHSCSFSISQGTALTVVSPWSVSIFVDKTGISNCKTGFSRSWEFLHSTRDSAKDISPTTISPMQVMGVSLEKEYCEPIPTTSSSSSSLYPQEQLSVTEDKTDYLWYSTTVPATTTEKNSTLSFSLATAGGGMVYLFVNGQRVGSYDPMNNGAAKKEKMMKKFNNPPNPTPRLNDNNRVVFTVPLSSSQENQISILSMTMGLQNYGAHMENVFAGIVSNVTLDGKVITGWTHTAGLTGETMKLFDPATTIKTTEKYQKKEKNSGSSSSSCSTVHWWRGVTSTQNLLANIQQQLAASSFPSGSTSSLSSSSSSGSDPKSFALSVALLSSSSSGFHKGSVWINGFQLGRYWDIVAEGVCDTNNNCASESYSGPYNADRCRTGCSYPSQTFYKIPSDILYSPER